MEDDEDSIPPGCDDLLSGNAQEAKINTNLHSHEKACIGTS